MGAVVSTCSATLSPSPWLPWILASSLTMWARGKLLYLSLLAIFPDWSLDLKLPDSGGQTSSFGKNSRLVMWAREKQLRFPLVFLLLSALTTHSAPLSLLDT